MFFASYPTIQHVANERPSRTRAGKSETGHWVVSRGQGRRFHRQHAPFDVALVMSCRELRPNWDVLEQTQMTDQQAIINSNAEFQQLLAQIIAYNLFCK